MSELPRLFSLIQEKDTWEKTKASSSLPSELHKGIIVENVQSTKPSPAALLLEATRGKKHLTTEVAQNAAGISEVEQSVRGQKK